MHSRMGGMQTHVQTKSIYNVGAVQRNIRLRRGSEEGRRRARREGGMNGETGREGK